MTAIVSVEELRGGLAALAPVTLALAVAGMDRDPGTDREAASAAFGLYPEIEPDTPGAEVGKTGCSWCGRANPEGGLTDQYPRPPAPLPAVDIDTGQSVPAGPKPAPPPPVDPATGLFFPPGSPAGDVPNPGDMHCADEQACQSVRNQVELLWFDNQFRSWSIDWDKYRQALAAQQAAQGGIYAPGHQGYWQLAAEPVEDELSQLELAALDQVRRAVENNLTARVEQLRLTAEPPAPVPAPVIRFDPWAHTLRHPGNRTHTLGHLRQHPSVHDAATALARKAVRDRP